MKAVRGFVELLGWIVLILVVLKFLIGIKVALVLVLSSEIAADPDEAAPAYTCRYGDSFLNRRMVPCTKAEYDALPM